MKKAFFLLMIASAGHAFAQAQEAKKAPFEGFNTTWINGQSRQTEFPLAVTDASGQVVVTAMAYVDAYYNYDLKRPLDNTHTCSASIGRHNEFTLNMATIGLESYYKNTIGRIWLQSGSILNLIQETDGSTLKGRNSTVSNLKYIREAAAGYHFNVLNGLNIEMGLFSSFIGMDSYLTQENWSYQRAMVNEFVPSYLTGARLQLFPSWKFKTELWLVNGWQSYSRWNKMAGIGSANLWRPTEDVQVAASLYVGKDSRLNTNRFHHDNSVALRYHNQPTSKGLSQAALALNTHYGFQWGDGAKRSEQNIFGISAMNRLWFMQNTVGLTLRYDYLTNPGLYLAFSPATLTPNSFTQAINNMDKPKLNISQLTATVDYMPNSFTTLRLELGYRKSNVPYFAGHDGTTSPDGWADSSTTGWTPSLVKDEARITIAAGFRL